MCCGGCCGARWPSYGGTTAPGRSPTSRSRWSSTPWTGSARTRSPRPILQVLADEQWRFAELLTRGRKVLAQFGPDHQLTAADLAYLHQTHGLPPELVSELLS